MANLIAYQDGNWSDPNTWYVLENMSVGMICNIAPSTSSTQRTYASFPFTPQSGDYDGFAVRFFQKNNNASTGMYTGAILQVGTSGEIVRYTGFVEHLPNTSNVTNAYAGPRFFKFQTPINFTGGTSYVISLRASASSLITFGGSGTLSNFGIGLRRMATQAPASGDILFIMGEQQGTGALSNRVVTYDLTSGVPYGPDRINNADQLSISISKGGILNFPPSGNTGYYLKWRGCLYNHPEGVINVGTPATGIPSGSTAILEPDGITAAGEAYLCNGEYATLNLCGSPKTYWTTLKSHYGGRGLATQVNTGISFRVYTGYGQDLTTLSPNSYIYIDNSSFAVPKQLTTVSGALSGLLYSVASTTVAETSAGWAPYTSGDPITIEVNNASGWISGDTLIFSELELNRREIRTITNVSGSFITLNSGFLYAHMGSGHVESHVANVSRNVTFGRVVAATGGCYKLLPSGIINFKNTYFSLLDTVVSSTRKDIYEYNSGFLMEGCGWSGRSNNITFLNFPSDQRGELTTIIKNNIIAHASASASSTIVYSAVASSENKGGIQFINNLFLGAAGGFSLNRNNWLISGNIFYRGNITFANDSFHNANQFSNNAFIGLAESSNFPINSVFENCMFRWETESVPITIGNTYNNCMFQSKGLIETSFNNEFVKNTFLNCKFASFPWSGITTIQTTSTQTNLYDNKFVNCDFSYLSGNNYIGATNDISISATGTIYPKFEFNNCVFNAATPISLSLDNFNKDSILSFVNYNKITGNNYIYKAWGVLSTDTTIVWSTSPSMRMTPISNNNRLQTTSFFVPVRSGQKGSAAVRVRQSSNSDGIEYNGAVPILVFQENIPMGITGDIIIASGTAGLFGTWQILTGQSSTAPQDGVMKFAVTCGGPAYSQGWVNVDDWR